MANFRQLKVWQKAHVLSLATSAAAESIRGRSFAALRGQLVRCAESVVATIVEGRASRGERQFARFVGMAIASTDELEHHLITARDRAAIDDPTYVRLLDRLIEVRRML
jgi:four helix bundle protein